MSRLRPTGAFAPIADETTHNDAAAPNDPLPARRPTGMPPDVWRTLNALRDLSIPDGNEAGGRFPAWRELPDLPRGATLAPRSHGGGLSARRPESTPPVALPEVPPSFWHAAAARELALQMNQRQRTAAIVELFDEAQAAAAQLVASLDDWAEDRTPTHRSRGLEPQRHRLWRLLSDLSALLQADKEGNAGGWALTPKQYRQAALLAKAFDIDASLRQEEASPEGISANQVLLRRLQDALGEDDEIY